MSKREFMMLADDWVPGKHAVGGWWMSEKLDGMRAFWDGGVSRGMLASDVPYANCAKDARYVTPPRATGLWSRYGKTIQAPDWWLDGLPVGVNLDVELWMGRGSFQRLMSVCKTLAGGESWRGVVAHVIDAPGWSQVLMDGELTGANWKGLLGQHMMPWVEARSASMAAFGGYGSPDEAFAKLRTLHASHDVTVGGLSWCPMDQVKLPQHPDDAREVVEAALQRVSSGGGEGLILRSGPWVPKRVPWVLKVKKLLDAEATVTGFTWGRRTGLGSRHLGRMGALVVRYDGARGPVRLELSGFNDDEREVAPVTGCAEMVSVSTGTGSRMVPVESAALEGHDATTSWEAVSFRRGSTVTFTYRELSRDGVPKEARYLRVRDE